MIELIDKILIVCLKKIGVRNQYCTNIVLSCFYSCLNKNNISKSMLFKTF